MATNEGIGFFSFLGRPRPRPKTSFSSRLSLTALLLVVLAIFSPSTAPHQGDPLLFPGE